MTLHLPHPVRFALPVLMALTMGSPTARAQRGGPGAGPSGFIDRMLSRLDDNDNEVLEPGEMEGRAQYFLRRLMPDADLSRPIPVDQIKRAIEERPGRGSGAPAHGGEDQGSGGDRGSSSSRSGGPSEPAVPGFGNRFNPVPVLEFGQEPPERLPHVEVTSNDERRAHYMMRYLDKDRNKVLSREEADKRPSLYDIFKSDANRDGKIDVEELSQYYARERLAREEHRRARIAASHRGAHHVAAGQRNPQSPNGRHEQGGGFSESGEGTDSGERRVYRSRTLEERLPGGLPAWFRQRDANQDGQVMMFEYASDWTDELVAEFNGFDANRDGVITPGECLAPTTESDETSPPATGAQAATETDASPEHEKSSPQPSASAPAPAEVSPAYMQYAEGIVKKYDKNGDGVLKADEWSEMSKSPEAADSDGNGELTAAEYAAWIVNQ